MSEKEQYIPIWFFIGALLAIYGVLILGAGIYCFFVPPKNVVLAQYHAGIWWGGLLLVIGILYTIRFWPGKEKSQGRS